MAKTKKTKTNTTPKYTWAMATVHGWKSNDDHPVVFNAKGEWIPITHNANGATGAVTGFTTTAWDTTSVSYLKGGWKNTPITVTSKTKTVPSKLWGQFDTAWN